MKNYKHFFIIAILVLATVLRIYNLGNVPGHLTPDEASLGYNAWSILKTGRDEYGKFMPLVFKSFGDYKPGLYVYLTVPFVWLLGLNEWAVRLPSAIAGIIAVWLIYLIAKQLFGKHRELHSSTPLGVSEMSLIVSFVLAINPWHIGFSRGAWEANVALTLSLSGIYFFFKFLNPKMANLLHPRGVMLGLSGLFFGLTLWMYQGAKLSTLLILFALVLVYGKKVWGKLSWKELLIGIGILSLIASPIAWGLFRGKTGGRLAVKSIFSFQRSDSYVNRMILKPANIEKNDLSFKLWQGEWLSTFRGILNRYSNYFSGRFLIAEGDWGHQQLTPLYMGVMYWFDMIILIFGFYFLFRMKGRPKWFIFIWLALAPLPAALTLDEINSVRSLSMVVPLVFLIGAGWFQVIKLLMNKMWLIRVIGLIGLTGITIFQLIYYLDSYYVLSPYKAVRSSQGYGYKEVVKAVQPLRKSNKKIIVYQSYDQPYIYFLFYEKFNPKIYREFVKFKENKFGDVGLVEKIDKQVEFLEYSWSAEKNFTGSVYVGNALQIPVSESSNIEKFKVIKDIYYPDGGLAFRIVEVLK